VPDSTVTLQPGATSATTSFSAGQWSTVAPPNTLGNDFMAGMALLLNVAVLILVGAAGLTLQTSIWRRRTIRAGAT
jgi:hypothetical protein